MITVINLSKSFRNQILFEEASLQINNGDRFALVGPNGAGKSTFFKMLLGQEETDSGEISIKKGAIVGYLPQENPPVSQKTVLEETLSDFPDPHPAFIAKAKSILMGLSFKEKNFTRSLLTLSGGWAMRVAMAKLLLKNPDLLLLDEPTNHLDLDSIIWLKNYLKTYNGAIFLISHDREFINSVCSAIVAVKEKKLKVYRGNYEKYIEESKLEKERIISAYKKQQDEIKDMQDFIYRNRARVSTAARAQSMIKRLEKLERIELPEETSKVKIRFPQPKRSGERVITLRKISKTYLDNNNEPIEVYKDLDFTLNKGLKATLVGPNGAGKSTLLKILAGVLPVDSGHRDIGVNVDIGYFSQHRQEQLNPEKTVLQEATSVAPQMKEVDIRTVLGTFLLKGDSVYKKTAVLSGGEKSRLSLVKILLNPPNVLFLDEPTTHLDIDSVEALISALKDYNGTLCFISHDVYFIKSLANNVFYVNNGQISIYPGDYDYFLSRVKENENINIDENIEENYEYIETDWEEEKRKRNQERQKLRKEHQLKGKILNLKKKIEELSFKLSEPGIYSNYQEVKKLNDEIQKNQEELEISEKELN